MNVFVVIALFVAVATAKPYDEIFSREKELYDVLNKEDSTPHYDCQSLKEAGYTKNGTYRLHINGTVFAPCRFTASGAFTTFLYRTDDDVSWNRNYATYELGFGLPLHDFFMGLQKIYEMTNKFSYSMTVEFEDWHYEEHKSTYERFSLHGPQTRYQLYLGQSTSGDVPASLLVNNGMGFQTYDSHYSSNACAATWGAGWWYNNHGCTNALPTGQYPIDLSWPKAHGGRYGINRLAMYVQRN